MAKDDTKKPDPGTRDPVTMFPRRDFLKASVVGAVGLSIAGCPAEPLTPGFDAGVGSDGGADGGPRTDGGSPDSGAPLDGGSDAGRDAGNDASADANTDANTDAPPGSVVPPEATPESATGFPMGVASGDVAGDTAICWAFYAGSDPLELVVWEMDVDTYVRVAYRGTAATTDGFAHFDVAGLVRDRAHRFAFFETSASPPAARSPIGRFRTPPADDALIPLTFGAVSCVSNMRTIQTIGHAGGRDDLSFFAFLGDSTYNDGAVSLAEYRAAWRSNIERPEYRALRAGTSVLATWDDHEFDNDYNPESLPPAQIANAIRTFFDHQPLRRDGASPDRVWKRMRWGATLEVFVLDCRNERMPSTRMTPGAQYISRAQMDWLKDGLATTTAVFKVILNSVPITDFPGLFDFQQQDRWEGYAAQRVEILSHIDSLALTGVLWVAGDFHLASSQRVANSGPGATQIEVLVGPAAQSPNPLAFGLAAPQFDFAMGANNYAVIELDPSTVRARVSWMSGTGTVMQTRSYLLGC